MKKLILSLLLITNIFFAASAFCQTCTCGNLLDSLAAKIETDYAGYIHKVVEQGRQAAYNNEKQRLQAQAAKTTFAGCYKVLDAYVDFFKDGHVFVMEIPPAD